MATIKSYTDLSQSKKLAEILPPESADMEYLLEHWIDEKTGRHKEEYYEIPVVKVDNDCPLQQITLPCWSLAALLGVVPYLSLHKTFSGWRCDSYNKEGTSCILGESTDNPIDSCYEMILKLHELKML